VHPAERKREFNEILIEAIDETITVLLSQGVAKALYDHLQATYSISRDEIPSKLDILLSTLEKTFGATSSRTISKVIARELYARLSLTFYDNPGRTFLEYVEDAKVKLQERGSHL